MNRRRPPSKRDHALDEAMMRLALEQAKKGLGRTSPNPAVGAVITKEGRVVAKGHHRQAGSDHAEVAALRRLAFRAEGTTLYTTLEPCDHVGRTGSCADAILDAGVARVVVGAKDPNPMVRGRGMRKLESAGVEVVRGVLEADCERINEAFNLAIVEHRPFVTLKIAASLDGKIATSKGESRWITSAASRRNVHRMRDQADAVLIGVNTVLADDPELTARFRGAKNPLRIVLDSRLRTPPEARIVKTAREIPTLVATTHRALGPKRRLLMRAGVDVVDVRATRSGVVDLVEFLPLLYERDVTSLLVEGGASVSGSFWDADLVDRVTFFWGPLLLGGQNAKSAVGGKGIARLSDAPLLTDLEHGRIGCDLWVTGRVKRRR